ncbi:MAG: beta-propeller domain-containing protein, partial [Bacillota bacterium]|nr:beta-propeller domain-containing protein [Bacillota bacterium]
MKHRGLWILLTVFLILIASTVWYYLFAQEHDNVSDDYIAIVGDEATYEHLLSLQGNESGMQYETTADSAMESNRMTEYSDVSKGYASDFSATNNQIATVDEGDIIKTNGHYICALNQQKVTVVRVQSDGAMKKENTIDIADESGEYGVALYLTEEELIVITQDFGGISTLSNTAKADDTIIATDTAADRGYGVTIAIYPITDTVSTEPNRTITMEGHYLTSRLSNGCLYMITEIYPNYETQTTEDSLPQYRDSFTGEKALSVGYNSIYYCPRDPAPGRQMTNIGALNLKGEHEINVQSFLGGGNEFYMNENALYLALNQYGWMEQT